MKIKSVLAFTLLLFAVQLSLAQGNYNALTWRMNTAYNNYLLRDVHQQYADRKAELGKAFQSKEAMENYRDERIRRYKSIIGDLPGKSGLNAKVLGTSHQVGFRVEKIIFESIPKRYVTANLYIPEGKGPFPVAVELCGHGLGGKIPTPKSAVLLALNGIAVMVVDPVGQGERIQFVDENSKTLTRGATTEHTLLNAGANLVGTSVAACEFWDNHRAIDYLMTRPDIDKDKIAAYGSSGGGTQISYLVGLDDRIKVASVCSYFSQRERVLEIYGPSDGCQHIPYEGREQLEIADFVMMMAPRPVLIMSGLYDFVDYWGATQGFNEMKKAYTVLGSSEKVEMFTIEGGHGMPKPKREALASWFSKWLLENNKPVRETIDISLPFEELQCTETGQVITAINDQISYPQYLLQLSKQFEKQRAEFQKSPKPVIDKKVKELLGIEIPKNEISAEPSGSMKLRNYDVLKFQINRSGQMPVPCVVCIPENVSKKSRIMLYLNEGGKDEILADENTMLSITNQDNILVLSDLRGFGETADPSSLNDTKYWNREYRNAMTSLHTGKPIVGQRVIDIITLLDFFNAQDQLKGHPVSVRATGTYGPVVIHAAYLDKRIENAEISGSIKSYNEYLENLMQRDMYSNVLYGVLKYYDLKDLADLSGKSRVRFIN